MWAAPLSRALFSVARFFLAARVFGLCASSLGRWASAVLCPLCVPSVLRLVAAPRCAFPFAFCPLGTAFVADLCPGGVRPVVCMSAVLCVLPCFGRQRGAARGGGSGAFLRLFSASVFSGATGSSAAGQCNHLCLSVFEVVVVGSCLGFVCSFVRGVCFLVRARVVALSPSGLE